MTYDILNIPIVSYFVSLFRSFIDYIIIPETISQALLIIVTFIVGYILSQRPTALLDSYFRSKWDETTLSRRNEEALVSLLYPLFTLIIQGVILFISGLTNTEDYLIFISAKLLLAWVVIRFVTALVRYPVWSKIIAVVAWVVVALSIINLLDVTLTMLDSYAFNVGEWRVSILTLMNGIISLVVLLWVAGLVARFMDVQINRLPNLTPSVKVLLSKFFKITIVVIALLVGLESFGIDLTALAVFGGAIGLGLGFGLQKVVSNLVSGVILLLDRSVKPGDVIEVADSFGWVNSLGARYVSVLTRDGVEHLIPNEHLITEKVVNWSHSSSKVRLKIPVGVGYNSDIRKAMELCLEAVHECSRVLPSPAPVCRLMEFGDSSVNIELRVWINDPVHGVANVRSDVLLDIWDKFHEHDISIPYPQRDVNIRSFTEEFSIQPSKEKPASKKKAASKKEK